MSTEALSSTFVMPHKSELRDPVHCGSHECWCWDDRYAVVTRAGISDLTEAVNAFIHQQGWKPVGGLINHDGLWAQAMVRFL